MRIVMHVLLTSFPLCRDGSRGEMLWERLGRLREGLGDPWHPFREFHKVWMPCNRIYGLLQEVCRGFYRKFRSSTGSSELLQEVQLFLQEALKPDFKWWESEKRLHGWLGG